MNIDNKLIEICEIYKKTKKLRYLFMKLPTYINYEKIF